MNSNLTGLLVNVNQHVDELLARQNQMQLQMDQMQREMNQGLRAMDQNLYKLHWRVQSNQLRQEAMAEIMKHDMAARHINNSSKGPDDALAPLALPLPPQPVAIPPINGRPRPAMPKLELPAPFPATRAALGKWTSTQVDALLAAYKLPVLGTLAAKKEVLMHHLLGQ